MGAPRLRTVITGGNRGLGLELARQCVARGDEVWVGCRRPADARVLAEVEPAGVLALDVADTQSIEAFGHDLAGRVDGVDLLLNNAGVDATAFGAGDDQRAVFDLDPEHLLGQVRINAVGPVLVTRALLPLLRASQRAVMVTLSSQLASMALGMEIGSDIGYCASKSALNRLTIAMARELQPDGIQVVAMHPGWVRTDMGGTAAPLSVEVSAKGVLRTIESLRPEDHAGFFQWDGTRHPW